MKFKAGELVTVYRRRVDIQENGIKHMVAHCALNINFGTKTILGLDRAKAIDHEELQSKQSKLQAKAQKFETVTLKF